MGKSSNRKWIKRVLEHKEATINKKDKLEKKKYWTLEYLNRVFYK